MTYRRTLGVLGLGALTVLLSACIKLNMNLTVHSNDTVSGSVIAGVSKQLLPALGGEQAVRDRVQQLLSENDLPAGVAITNYSDDSYSGIKATFENLAIDDVNNRLASQTEGPLIKHENGRFIVDTTLPLSGDAFGVGDLGVAAGTGDIRIVVTFPGRVLSHNGQLDGTTVTWRGTLGQDLVMQAVSEDSGAENVSGSGGGGMAALWIGLAALLAAGLVGFFLYQRNRRATPAAASTGSQDTTGTIADYDQPAAGSAPAEPPTQEYGTWDYATPATADPAAESGGGAGADTSTTAVLSDVSETAAAPPSAEQPAGGNTPEPDPPSPAGPPPADSPPASDSPS